MIPVKLYFFQHFLFEFVEIWFRCFSIVPIFPVDIQIGVCSNYLLIMRPGLYCGCGTTGVLFFVRNVRTGSAMCMGISRWRNQLCFHQNSHYFFHTASLSHHKMLQYTFWFIVWRQWINFYWSWRKQWA